MEPNQPGALLFFKVGMFNALVVTIVSAVAIAVISGAGTDAMPNDPQFGTQRDVLQRMSDVGKAAVMLSPLTAISCGPFGLVAGATGAWLMARRNRRGEQRAGSLTGYVSEVASLGLALGILYLFCDALINWAMGTGRGGVLVILAPALGVPCAIASGLAFRRQFWS